MQHNLYQKQVIEISRLCREISNSVGSMASIDFQIEDLEFLKSFKEESSSILDSISRIHDDLDNSEFASGVK